MGSFSDLSPDNTIIGGTDSTTIGNTGDRLKTTAIVTGVIAARDVISSPQIEYGFTKVDLPSYGQSFYTVSTVNDSGALHGFALRFNSDGVIIRLEIDGSEVFEIEAKELKDHFKVGNKDDRLPVFNSMWLIWNEQPKVFLFNPSSPISFNSSFTVKVKGNSGSTDRDLRAYQITYEEL